MIKLHYILLLLISFFKGGILATFQTLECQFTDDFCQWKDLDWNGWVLGDYSLSGFGQPAKQIDNINSGFIYTQSPTKISVLESPVLDDKESFCLYFNYFMFGTKIGSLELQLESIIENSETICNTKNETVWKQEGSKYDDWILGKYHFDPLKINGDKFRLKFIATSDDISIGSILVKPGSCDFDNTCDFENPSSCFWLIEPDYKSNFRWLVSNGSNSENDLVGFDATTHTADGHFVRTPTNGFIGSSSDLISTIFFSSNQAKCLSFQVFKKKDASDFLQLSLESPLGYRSIIWSQSYVTNQQWVKVNVDISPMYDYAKLILSASRHTEKSSPIAVDELAVSPESCSSPGTCNFDYGLCDYTIKSGELLVGFGRLPYPNAINWTPLKNIDPYDLFVYTNTQNNDKLISYSLESPFIDSRLGKTCLAFSYALTYKQDGKFSIKATSSEKSDSKTIWSLNPAISEEKWKTIEIPLSDAGQNMIKFSFEFSGVQLFAAIDDIVVNYCEDQKIPVCFHDGLIDKKCINIVPSAFNNWVFKSPSEVPKTKKLQYNFKNDFVLFFDQTGDFNDIILFSHFYISNLKPNSEYCLKFWYYINGNIALDLWVDRMDSDFNQYLRKSPLIKLSARLDDNWTQAKIQLDSTAEESKLIFGANYTGDVQGTIIIDGLELTEGTCSIDYNYFCDFEKECPWNNLHESETLVLIGSGEKYKATTDWANVAARTRNPYTDSTLGTRNGHYMALKKTFETAILVFPPIYLNENTTEMCLSLKAYRIGKNSILVIKEQDGVLALVEKSSMSLYSWKDFEAKLRFNLDSSKVARIYLVGSGALAVDDISLKTGSCGDPFVCKNGEILSNHRVCDFIDDCSTGEDEQNCGSCSFENDFCGYWKDHQTTWSIKNGQASVKSKQSFWSIRDKNGELTSQPLGPTAPTCKLKFNYRGSVEAKSNNKLKVLLIFQDGHTVEVWDETMLRSIQNSSVEINLGRIPISFNLHFFAQMRSSSIPLSFGPIKLTKCGYQDTVDSLEESEIYTCKNGRRISLDQLCDQSIDCFDGDDESNCDNYRIYSFEDKNDATYWINLSKERSKWTLTLAETGDQVVVTPPRDHSKGLENSYYMALYPKYDIFMDVSGVNKPTEVKLAGPELTSVDNCSIVFYYNIAGVTLLVSLVDSDSNFTQLLELPFDDVFGFKRQRINLKKGDISVPFNLVFTARFSQSELGNYKSNYYAIIDDIVISGSCFEKSENSTTDCPKDEFRCKTDVGSVCLPNDKLCDYNQDCLDGIDELYCGPCEFDNQSLCGWANLGEDNWVVFDKYKGNKKDAKIPEKNKPENFIVPEKRSDYLRAILRSPRLSKTSQDCRFNFTYFLADKASMTVRLRNDRESGSKELFEIFPTNEQKWEDKSLKLKSLDPGYYIQFVLDVEPVTNTIVRSGLGSFQFIDCDPDIKSTTTTTTTTITSTSKPTSPVTEESPQPTTEHHDPTSSPKIKSSPHTEGTSQKSETNTPSVSEATTSDKIIPITVPTFDKTKRSQGITRGSVSFILLGIITLILGIVFVALYARRRTRLQHYEPPNGIPLIENSNKDKLFKSDDVDSQRFQQNADLNIHQILDEKNVSKACQSQTES